MNKKTLRLILSVIYVIALIALTFIAIPFLKSFENPEEFKNYIDGFGIWGFIVVILIQIAQIVISVIPGELVEFATGAVFGWFGGLLLCLIGIALGQTIVFCLVKFLGKDFIDVVAGSKAMGKLKFLQNEKKLKTLIFILFFLPGTPKDLVTYIVPLTKIKLKDYLFISLFARIPSIISSTYAGSLFIENDFKMLVIIYGAVAILTLIGFIAYKAYEKLVN